MCKRLRFLGMPGNNHDFWCFCPLCGGGGGSSTGSLNLSSSLSNSLSVAQTEGAQTHQTECWWCGELVYYHTNGYGDHVLFDSLGYPWQIHECWAKYWQGERNKITRNSRINNSYSSQENPNQITVFHRFDKIQQKHLILAGILLKLDTDGELATEENVASKMGLKVEVFRKTYLYHYNLYRDNGITQIRLEHSRIYQPNKNTNNHDGRRKTRKKAKV